MIQDLIKLYKIWWKNKNKPKLKFWGYLGSLLQILASYFLE